jgi:hypothetical protein
MGIMGDTGRGLALDSYPQTCFAAALCWCPSCNSQVSLPDQPPPPPDTPRAHRDSMGWQHAMCRSIHTNTEQAMFATVNAVAVCD